MTTLLLWAAGLYLLGFALTAAWGLARLGAHPPELFLAVLRESLGWPAVWLDNLFP